GPEREAGHAVAEPGEGVDRPRGGCALQLEHRLAGGGALLAGARRVEQDENAEFAAVAQGVDVDGVRGRVPGRDGRLRVDGGVEGEVEPGPLLALPPGPEAEAAEFPAQRLVAGRSIEGCELVRAGEVLDDRAELRPVRLLVLVPLRIHAAVRPGQGA